MRFLILVPLSFTLFASVPRLYAQNSGADSLRSRALTTYRQKAFSESAVAYARLAEQGAATPVDLYNAACSAALAGDSASAFAFLDRAIAAGFDSYDQIKIDPDLTSLHPSSHWQALTTRTDSLEFERKRVLAMLPDPFKAFGALRDSGYLATLLDLEAMRRDHRDAPLQWQSGVGEALGWTRAMVGDEIGSITLFDSLGDQPAAGSPVDLTTYTPHDAVREIAERARSTRLVMINEAHHVSMHRALTTELLPALWKEGYRYLAVEAAGQVMSRDSNAIPTLKSGTYVKDPVFADMLRAAVRLGFTVVPYDSFAVGCVATADAPMKCFSARDSLAAAKLYRQVFARDPQAKVVVHAGYSHVVERPRSARGAKPVAYWLAAMTGIDPLTVDQTEMYGHPSPAYDTPVYRQVAARGWLSSRPIVLRAANGDYYRSPDGGFGGVDMQVFTPHDTLVDGRPGWLFNRLARRRVRLDDLMSADGKALGSTDRCENVCLVQAFIAGEPENAIPFDQAITSDGRVTLALQPGRYRIRTSDRKGKIGERAVEVR